jgi:hypothetical protein
MFKETTEVSVITQGGKSEGRQRRRREEKKKVEEKTRDFPRDLPIGHSAA